MEGGGKKAKGCGITQGKYNIWFAYYQHEACGGMMAPWIEGTVRSDCMECSVCGAIRTEEEFQELVKKYF